MKNALEVYRTEHRLTYRQLQEKTGGSLNAVFRHCAIERIPAEAAHRYSSILGIPLAALRPDLCPPQPSEVVNG